MKSNKIFIVLMLLAVGVFAYLGNIRNHPDSVSTHKETTAERVLRTGEIRCAY